MYETIVKTFIIILFVFCMVQGQQDKPELQIPSSPGMSIIGLQNAEVTKPGNYAGLYANIISPILSNNGTVPSDLSVEFSPYYLKSQDLTFTELYTTNMYRDLKLSIASTSVNVSDTLKYSRLGIGIRTNLLSGYLNTIDKKKIKLSMPNEIETTIFKIESGAFDSTANNYADILTLHFTYPEIKAEVMEIILSNKNNRTALLNELELLKEKYEKLIEVDGSRWDYSLRTGHFLEIAAAVSFDFPKNILGFSKLNRWGFWANYTYRPEFDNQSLDLSALLRISNYSFDPIIVLEEEYIFIDLGAGFNWKIPDTRFVCSGEFISKFGFSDIKSSGINEITLKNINERKWNISIGYQITENTMWNITLSDLIGESDYLKNNSTELLMGLSVALASLQK